MQALVPAQRDDVPTTPCAFEFRSSSAATVSLAGDWNDWKPVPMRSMACDGNWSWALSVDLPAGEVHFKFVVNETEWVTDSAYEEVDDGHGGMNNVREVALPAPKVASDEEVNSNGEQKDENSCVVM